MVMTILTILDAMLSFTWLLQSPQDYRPVGLRIISICCALSLSIVCYHYQQPCLGSAVPSKAVCLSVDTAASKTQVSQAEYAGYCASAMTVY